MSEVIKDSAIKLFGKTIPLPFADKAVSDVSLSHHRHSSCATSTSQDTKDEWESSGTRDEYESMKQSETTSSETSPDPETAKKDESSDGSEEKAVKKADKIIPCPRCNSMQTKFCYYNNYNVNQPRYFCKNCQRYWTSGGTMRNVPVGSGRRKAKSYQSATNGVDLSSLKANAFLVGHSGFPVTFYPAALFWGGSAVASPCITSPSCVLGKHSREGAAIRPSNLGKENLGAETSVMIPKTLRIHDPGEAAKSSIWTTLGIKNDKAAALNRAGLFKAFEPKGDRQSRVDRRAVLLQANPAALSRSLNFHETM